MEITRLVRRPADSLAAAAVGFALTCCLAHQNGIGLSPDSIAYLSAARSLLHSGRVTDFSGFPLVIFPAGYPAFLAALAGLTGIDPFRFAPFVGPLMFAGLILLTGTIASRSEPPNAWWKPLVLSCLALSPALVEVYIMLWSETLFLVLLLLFCLALKTYLDRRTPAALCVAAGLAALACVTRYAGVTLVGAGALLILVERYPSPRRRWMHLLCFCALSLSLLALNLWRNECLAGNMTGLRQRGVTPLIDNVFYVGTTISGWFCLGSWARGYCIVVALAALLFVCAEFARRARCPAHIRIALAFSLVYMVFIILSATISRFQPIDSRLLIPLYIPLLLSVTYTGARWIRRWGLLVVGAWFLLLQARQVKGDLQWWADVSDSGIGGYTEDLWNDSPIVHFLRARPEVLVSGYQVYSNAPEAVYFFSGRESRLLPERVFPNIIRAYYNTGHQYLVWFDNGEDVDVIPLEKVLANKKMVRLYHFDDGAIYVTGDDPRPVSGRGDAR